MEPSVLEDCEDVKLLNDLLQAKNRETQWETPIHVAWRREGEGARECWRTRGGGRRRVMASVPSSAKMASGADALPSAMDYRG